MKRIIALAAALCLLFAGCASQNILPLPEPLPEAFAAAEPLALLPQPAASPVPTPAPDPLTPPGEAYTIAWLSDTQHYSEEYPATYLTMTEFLRDNADRMSLAYIVHTGDLVHSRKSPEQWAVADEAQRTIDDLPNGVLAGNHDVGSEVEYSYFCEYFGQSRYSGKPWYGGSYQDNRCHYDLIDAGNTSYIFVYVGSQPDGGCIEWARAAFDKYPERIGVLCAHEYFNTDLSYNDFGQALYDGVVQPCGNVWLVLCGHRYNIAAVPVQTDDGRGVVQMICNYQAAGQEGGGGYMRFMQVDEAAGEIYVRNYSPLLRDYDYWDTPGSELEKYVALPENESFTLPIPWLLPGGGY